MKNYTKAFTLSELLVALGVIGILCAILLPVIVNLLPNQNTMMAKRAYYMVQSVVSDLINDESCYPDKSNSASGKRYGFDDGFAYSNCVNWDAAADISTEANAGKKFVTLYTDKVDVSSTNIGTDGKGSFTTKDGMSWSFDGTGFASKASKTSVAKLIVDVNGKEAPNCGQSTASNVDLGDGATLEGNDKCNAREKGFDRFVINIYEDGRLKVDASDTWALNAIKVNKDITEDK